MTVPRRPRSGRFSSPSTDEARVDQLLAVAERLVRRPRRVLVLAGLVPDAAELPLASARLEGHRTALEARGVVVRAAAFTSSAPGADLARLATELDVELLLAGAPDDLLAAGAPDEQLAVLLAETPCDVALLVPRDATPPGPVLVPFGGAEHDWAAVELGAWLARADGAPLRLAGAAAVPEQGRRDASRLLSHGALAVQRVLGIPAEPLLTPPGEDGMLEASRDAGLLVVGLSTRWHREGLGPARAASRGGSRPADAARAARPAPGRPRSAGGADALHVVDRPSARAGGLVGPAGEEPLPLPPRQRPVGECAGAARPRIRIDVPDRSLAVGRGHEQAAPVRREVDQRRPACPCSTSDRSASPSPRPRGRRPAGHVAAGGEAGNREDRAVGAELEVLARPRRRARGRPSLCQRPRGERAWGSRRRREGVRPG